MKGKEMGEDRGSQGGGSQAAGWSQAGDVKTGWKGEEIAGKGSYINDVTKSFIVLDSLTLNNALNHDKVHRPKN